MLLFLISAYITAFPLLGFKNQSVNTVAFVTQIDTLKKAARALYREEPLFSVQKVEEDLVSVTTLPVSRQNDSFQVQLVSYNRIRQALLQKKLTDYISRYDSLKQKMQEKDSPSLYAADLGGDQESLYFQGIDRSIERVGKHRFKQLSRRHLFLGQVEVRIVLRSTGQLLRLEILTSSGNSEVDRELLASVQAAAPFPPVPPSLRQSGIDIIFDRWLSFSAKK